MPEYHLYLLNAEDHIVAPAIVRECATDDEAAFVALREIGTSVAVEIWCGNRMVGQIKAQ